MQLLHADGFKIYNGTNALCTEAGYTIGSGIVISASDSTNRFAGQGSFYISPEGYTLAHSITSTSDRLIGFAYRPSLIPTTTTPLMICAVLNGTTRQLELCVSKDLELIVRKNGTELSRSAPNVLVFGAWVYIQFRAVLHNTNGSYAVHVVGGTATTVLEVSGVSTSDSSASMDSVIFGHIGTVPSITTFTGVYNAFTDYTLYDPQGAAISVFNGDQRISTIAPTGDGAVSGMTGSDGNSVNNYALLNVGTTATTSYVTGTLGAVDTYATADLPATVTGNIKALSVYTRANKTDAGTRTLGVGMRQGGVNYSAATIPLFTTVSSKFGIVTTNPATSSAFTIAEVNANELYVEVL